MGRTAVALGGDCLVDVVLTGQLVDALEARGLRALTPCYMPPGDAGLSFGQAWVAALTIDGA